jgi:hypothetical protein
MDDGLDVFELDDLHSWSRGSGETWCSITAATGGNFGDDLPAFETGVIERGLLVGEGYTAAGRPACERANLNFEVFGFAETRCDAVSAVGDENDDSARRDGV